MYPKPRCFCNFLPTLIALALLAPLANTLAVTLEWDANPEPNVAGYKVYIGSQSRQFDTVIDVGPATQKPLESLQAGRLYYFAVTAYDSDGLESELSEEITYTVSTLTTATPLANATVCAGEGASFVTIAAGLGPFGFVWKKDGALIAGATNANLTLTTVSAANAGTYTVKVTGARNAVTNAASLVVREMIGATPISAATRFVGESVMFQTTLGGTGPFIFVWRKDGVILSSQTNGSLSIGAVAMNDSGFYTLIVEGMCNAVTNAAMLTVTMIATNALPVPLSIRLSDAALPVAISFLSEAGRQYTVQASADLQSWQTIHTLAPLINGTNQWADADAANHPTRFYRVLGSQH